MRFSEVDVGGLMIRRGPTQRRDPVSSSSGGQPHHCPLGARPITASSTILGQEQWTAIELARRQRYVMSARQTPRIAFANIELMSTGGI